MAKKIYDIPGTARKMYIEQDDAGKLLKVTDEDGNDAKTVAHGELKIKFGDIEAAIIDVPEGTTFVTKHNPTCRWVFIKGQWRYICV